MKLTIKRAMIAALALAVGSSGASGENLQDAMRWAYENNAELSAARANIRSTRETVIATNSAALPQINFSASYGYRRFEQPDFFGNIDWQSNDTLSASVRASLLLYDGGRNKLAVDSALAQLRAQLLQLQMSEQQVLFNVVQSYIEILRAEQLVALARNNIRVLDVRRESVQIAYDAGSATRGELALTEASVAQARAELASHQAGLQNARSKFQELTGRAPGALSPLPQLPQLPASLEAAASYAERRSPAILASIEAERAAQYDLRRARAASLPEVSASVEASRSNALDGSEPLDNYGVGVNVSVPIYTGGRNSALIRQAEALLEARLAQTNQNRALLRNNVSNAWANFQNASTALQATREVVSARVVADDGAEVEFDLGAIALIDRLTIQQDLLDARSNEVTASYNRQLAAYSILLAMGTLGNDIIGNDIPKIDPLVTQPKSEEATRTGQALESISGRWSD